jgi:hypothetical protein
MTDARTVPRTKRRTSEPVTDAGPAPQLRRGEVAVHDAADPDQPNRTIRRAKRVWAPDVLLATGTIGQHHHDAATRYHNAYAVGIEGARDRLGVYVDCAGSPGGYADARLSAARDYREATQAVGVVSSAALAWCVLSYGTVAGWAECKAWNKHKAGGYLLAALDRLAEHYAGRKGLDARDIVW